MRHKKRQSSPARAAMKLLCLALGLILAAMLAATAYFRPMTGELQNLPADISTEDAGQALRELLSELTPDSSGGSTIGGTGSGLVNILLIGQDSREGEPSEGARSDSMILCTFNRKEKALIMTSFLRDLYLPIPGYGSNRLNAAYSFGGRELLEQTIEENFDVQIDGVVEVDFTQFAQIVDALGGVTLELRQDEADTINQETGSALTAGEQLLNGQEALTYARIRKLDADGDFSRTSRQRKVMAAMLSTYKNSGVTTMLSLAKELLPMVDTDISGLKLLKYAVELMPMLSDAEIVSQSVPAPGTYTDQNIDGMAVLVADLDSARQQLRESLQNG